MRPTTRFYSILKGCGALGLGLLLSCSDNRLRPSDIGWTNSPPGNVDISGPTTAVTGHASIYNLSAVDPEADTITFSTTTTGATINGAVLTFTPTVAGPATLSVIATDSKGAASAPRTFVVNVTIN